MSSIFTRIIQGELPSYKLYEDEHVRVSARNYGYLKVTTP